MLPLTQSSTEDQWHRTSGPVDMRMRLDPELERFQAEVRAHISSAMTPELEEKIYTTGVYHDPEFTAGLAQKGWYAADLADGQRLSPFQTQILIAELHRADAPMYLGETTDRKSTRLNSSHVKISYAV